MYIVQPSVTRHVPLLQVFSSFGIEMVRFMYLYLSVIDNLPHHMYGLGYRRIAVRLHMVYERYCFVYLRNLLS